jgi:D-lactate dehydrogenase
MKAVVYSSHTFEKELLAKANQKKHDITLISNPLSLETAFFAEGKDAVIVFTTDDVSAPVIAKLKSQGVRYIATRSFETDHIDREAAALAGMKVANIPFYAPEGLAEYALTLMLSLSRKVVWAATRSKNFDFSLKDLQGFSLNGKTVGIVGLGEVSKVLIHLLKAFGCKVLVYDLSVEIDLEGVEVVSLEQLLGSSDIISLHAPLKSYNQHLINEQTLALFKKGAILINTSNGGLVASKAVLEALKSGKLGGFAADVYEFERNLFFEDHSRDTAKDALLEELMAFPNVIITPHQGFLTDETLQGIAIQTIKNLDKWQANKCAGKACACANSCQNKEKDHPHSSDDKNQNK